MAVELPTHSKVYPFSTEVEVRLDDLSGGFHLGNHMIVNYVNEAMARLFKAMGLDGLQINDISLINRELAISYRSEGNYADRIEIDVAIESFEERQYTLIYRLYNRETKRELAHVRGLYASFDYQQRKMVPVPTELVEGYRALTSGK